ncbi:MAG: AIPR family protein [Pseudomonadota bacterium]
MARAPHNTETIVREFVEGERRTRSPEKTISDYFEYFCPQVLLRDRGLSDDEVERGVVGNGGDGGIDSFYIFVNDILVAEDTVFTAIRNGAKVEVEIIQSKLERKFSEDTLNRLTAVTDALFGMQVAEDDFDDVYNADVRAVFALFRDTYRRLLRRAPTLSIRYRYATIRPPNEVSAGLEARKEALRNAALARFPDADVNVDLLGAAELWEAIIRRPLEVRTLATERASSGRHGYICLAPLKNLDQFLRDDDGAVSQAIFEENVRDWQGFTSVNESIATELGEQTEREFWWLNNGVTILCTDFRNDDNLLSITNPKIVNGLQTCKEITQHFDGLEDDDDEDDTRSLLVKVIRTDDDDTRDRIIRATNSQNAVSVAMLRATDPFQRQIEEFILPRDLYYERRKNYYSNRGRPSRKIVSLTFMTQAALTFLEFRPDDARARPSNPLKREDEYRQLVNTDIPLDAFYKAVKICREVELYLREHEELAAKEVNNLRFYVAMVGGWVLADSSDPSTGDIAALNLILLNADVMGRAYRFVNASYRRLGADDDVVKGAGFKMTLRRKARRQGLP